MSHGSNFLRSVVRRARRLPGYRLTRRSLLKRVRDSDTARDVVNRIFAGSTQSDGRLPRRFPSAGNVLDGLGIDQLPVAVISLVGVPGERIDSVIDDVARLQILSASFRPVFVLDSPRLDSPRRYGYVAELIVPASEWTFTDVRWNDYASGRMSDILRRYESALTVTVPPEGLNESVRIMLQAMAPR